MFGRKSGRGIDYGRSNKDVRRAGEGLHVHAGFTAEGAKAVRETTKAVRDTRSHLHFIREGNLALIRDVPFDGMTYAAFMENSSLNVFRIIPFSSSTVVIVPREGCSVSFYDSMDNLWKGVTALTLGAATSDSDKPKPFLTIEPSS